MTAAPHVVVLAGGGGVGKTTTSAALALSLARQGYRTLIVTIDPARRLAGAMGVALSDRISPVPVGFTGTHGGGLWALMPDPRRSLGTLIEQLFEDEPDAKDRMLNNRLYVALSDAAAGVHELVAMNLVARAAADFEVIVIDTAPSRHAIDFITYPGKLAALLGGRPVAWLGGMAERAAGIPTKGGLLSWGTNQVEALLARVTGPHLLRDTANMFGDLAVVRERFVALTRHASELLLGARTAYVLVAAPTAAAQADVRYLARRLLHLGRVPRALVFNRADHGPAPFASVTAGDGDLPVSVVEALSLLAGERAHRVSAADRLASAFAATLTTPVIRLPHVERATPEAVVEVLSRALDPHTDGLVPRRRP